MAVLPAPPRKPDLTSSLSRLFRDRLPLFRDPPLRMVWTLSRAGRISRLVGTAHFFPYRFRRDFSRLIREAAAVLFEGPLDEAGLARAAEHGRGDRSSSLLDSLSAGTIETLRRRLAILPATGSSQTSLARLMPPAEDLPGLLVRGMRPWLAFFTIWSGYLRTLGWRHSPDLEAYGIAGRQGRRICFLETIEEQIAALEAVPVERFIAFLEAAEHWPAYAEEYRRRYLAGDIEGLGSGAGAFPTRCNAIVGCRDPLLFERMRPFVEEGGCLACLGSIHIPGIRARFAEAGWEIRREIVYRSDMGIQRQGGT
jgi:hypothetical protein